MHEETVGSKIVKWVLIGVSVLFLVLMLRQMCIRDRQYRQHRQCFL